MESYDERDVNWGAAAFTFVGSTLITGVITIVLTYPADCASILDTACKNVLGGTAKSEEDAKELAIILSLIAGALGGAAGAVVTWFRSASGRG